MLSLILAVAVLSPNVCAPGVYYLASSGKLHAYFVTSTCHIVAGPVVPVKPLQKEYDRINGRMERT